MHAARLISRLLIAALLAGAGPAFAFDNGQYENVPPKVRDWFRSVRSAGGGLCCDIADGHVTTWRVSAEGHYEVFLTVENSDGTAMFSDWVEVPDRNLVTPETPNPTGESIAWFTVINGKPWVRCFAPGDGS